MGRVQVSKAYSAHRPFRQRLRLSFSLLLWGLKSLFGSPSFQTSYEQAIKDVSQSQKPIRLTVLSDLLFAENVRNISQVSKAYSAHRPFRLISKDGDGGTLTSQKPIRLTVLSDHKHWETSPTHSGLKSLFGSPSFQTLCRISELLTVLGLKSLFGSPSFQTVFGENSVRLLRVLKAYSAHRPFRPNTAKRAD